MHRLIVTSAAYRQSSRATPEQLARDPRTSNWAAARGSGSRPRSCATSRCRPPACAWTRSAARASSRPSPRVPPRWPTARPPGRPAPAPTATAADYIPTSSGPRPMRRSSRWTPHVRGDVRPPRAVEHAAPGIDAAQRHRVRRGVAGHGATDHPRVPRSFGRGPCPTCLPPRPGPLLRGPRSWRGSLASISISSPASARASSTRRRSPASASRAADPPALPGAASRHGRRRTGCLDDRRARAAEPGRDGDEGMTYDAGSRGGSTARRSQAMKIVIRVSPSDERQGVVATGETFAGNGPSGPDVRRVRGGRSRPPGSRDSLLGTVARGQHVGGRRR